MRTEQEVFVSELVHKHLHQLVEQGAALIRQDKEATTKGDLSMGAAVFTKLLEGCLLTLGYSRDKHLLCVLDWRFTDPACN